MTLNINDLASDATKTFVSPPTPDRGDAETFLSALDPTATKFTFQVFDDNKDRKTENVERMVPLLPSISALIVAAIALYSHIMRKMGADAGVTT